jgi:HTH-type transcriptional regulator/antitoxin HigA
MGIVGGCATTKRRTRQAEGEMIEVGATNEGDDETAGRSPELAYPPGRIIRDKLEARGWTQGDLAEIMGRPERLVSELIGGKKQITAETALGLATAFADDDDALYWMTLDCEYLLKIAKPLDKSVKRRARLYFLFPIREMLKRKWIEPSDKIRVLETQVCKFFRIAEIGDKLPLFHDEPAAKIYVNEVIQAAWLYRARELAEIMQSNTYSEQKLRDALIKLRALLIGPEANRQVPHILAEAGVRFVIVESLPGEKIDGAALWLNETPVIALSLRIDHVANFWFLLRHEIEHILRRDGLVEIDVELVERMVQKKIIAPSDLYANNAAADFLIPIDKCDLFIASERPRYLEQNIIAFAQSIGVHPGIVIGQLQSRGEISDTRFRKLAVKIREAITPESVVDGWGTVAYTPRCGA